MKRLVFIDNLRYRDIPSHGIVEHCLFGEVKDHPHKRDGETIRLRCPKSFNRLALTFESDLYEYEIMSYEREPNTLDCLDIDVRCRGYRFTTIKNT